MSALVFILRPVGYPQGV